MRVLALVPGGISDQLLFLPTAEALKRAFPMAEIHAVVEPNAKSAYRVSKLVDEVIPFDYFASNSPADWANLIGIIRDREFEIVLCASDRWKEGFLLWLSGIPTRIAYQTTGTPWFYTQTVPNKPAQYLAYRYHDLLQALNISGECPPLTLNVPEGDIAWADALRTQLALTQGYVLLYPASSAVPAGAEAVPDIYPLSSWVTIIQDFQTKQPQLPVILMATAESQATVKALTQQVPSAKSVEAQNLGQAAALIAGADLLIAPDSDILQLAVALKVFTLALLGARDAHIVLPPVDGGEPRFVGLQSPTASLPGLAPDVILQKVWGG